MDVLAKTKRAVIKCATGVSGVCCILSKVAWFAESMYCTMGQHVVPHLQTGNA